MLLKNNISFSAQVKIAHHENPVFGIFHLFVEAYIEQQTILKDGGALGDYHDYFNLVIKCYIDHLQINVNFNGEKLINTFFSEVRDYGFFDDKTGDWVSLLKTTGKTGGYLRWSAWWRF